MSRDSQPRDDLPQDVDSEDSDAETEFNLEDFSSEMKGNIIIALYEKACRDPSFFNEVVAGDTTRMRECIRQVASNDPVGRYFLSTPGGIGAPVETERIILGLLVRMVIIEDMEPLSEAAREKWVDEMCERMEWSDSDGEEGKSMSPTGQIFMNEESDSNVQTGSRELALGMSHAA